MKRVLPGVMQLDDIDLACHYGDAVVGAISSAGPGAPPEKAALLGYAAAAICAELEAREARLQSALFLKDLSGTGRVQLSTDARLRSERLYARAASRYYAAWELTVDVYGLDCPRMKARDEALYLVGLIAGDLALVADGASGTRLGIPQNTILEVARGSSCLSDADWWGVPGALRGAAWATVPGSGPEGTDPWALLDEAAGLGEASGIQVARALQVFTAANAGRQDVLESAIEAHGAAVDAGDADGDWALLDAYALSLSLFESDQLWIAAEGRRTESFGTLPGGSDVGDDPFGDDPFGADPFGAPPPGDDAGGGDGPDHNDDDDGEETP